MCGFHQVLECVVEKGMKHGHKIILPGEADQLQGMIPGCVGAPTHSLTLLSPLAPKKRKQNPTSDPASRNVLLMKGKLRDLLRCFGSSADPLRLVLGFDVPPHDRCYRQPR